MRPNASATESLKSAGSVYASDFSASNVLPERRIAQACNPLGAERQIGDLLVDGPLGERVARAHQSEQVAYRPARMLREDGLPFLGGAPETDRGMAGNFGRVVRAGSSNDPDVRKPGLCADPSQRRKLIVEGRPSKPTWRPMTAPVFRIGRRSAQRDQFIKRKPVARSVLATHRAMVDVARSRETERSGFHRLAHDGSHPLQIAGSCDFIVHPALAHHVAAHRRMRNLHADVDGELPPAERGNVFRKSHPVPVDARREAKRSEMSSIPDISSIKQSAVRPALPARSRRPQPAHDDRGNPMPTRRGRKLRIPMTLVAS